MPRHTLTFRGADAAIPFGCGRCTVCGRVLEIEAWLTTDCEGRDAVQLPATDADVEDPPDV